MSDIDCAQVSISSTLNPCVFRTNVISAAFSSYMYIVKAAETYGLFEKFLRLTLMKLTTEVYDE